ncbi:MAG: endonuclease/exonuclease/phosphatase family protein [Deltaproteobacteria bacterium]
MPLFYRLDGFGKETARVADRLEALRHTMQNNPVGPRRSVPGKNATETLLLATWNLKEFEGGQNDQRTPESYWYIAEIISHFDLVAIQEVGANLGALNKLRDRLGHTWKFVVSDVTEGSAGNKERLAFLFDRRKIRFSGVAGEIVIPPIEDKNGKTIAPANQLARTPTIVGFEAGWFRFMLATVHIIWGRAMAEDPKRVTEIKALAEFLKARSEDPTAWSRNLILLGDFNIFNADPSNAAFNAITQNGFQIPEALQNIPPSNVGKKPHFYDQIAMKVRQNNLAPTGRGGIFDYFDVIYRNEDYQAYVPAMMGDRAEDDPGNPLTYDTRGNLRSEKQRRAYYRNHWRRRQMSDHLVMWLELRIDYGEQYLEKRRADS